MPRCTEPDPYYEKLNATLGLPFNLLPHQVATIRMHAITAKEPKEVVATKLGIRMGGVANALKRGDRTRHPVTHYQEMIAFLAKCPNKDWDKITKPF